MTKIDLHGNTKTAFKIVELQVVNRWHCLSYVVQANKSQMQDHSVEFHWSKLFPFNFTQIQSGRVVRALGYTLKKSTGQSLNPPEVPPGPADGYSQTGCSPTLHSWKGNKAVGALVHRVACLSLIPVDSVKILSANLWPFQGLPEFSIGRTWKRIGYVFCISDKIWHI